MTKRHSRRRGLSAFFLTAALLVLASTAYACTHYIGRMTVEGLTPGSSGSVTRVGSGDGMTYCNDAGSETGQADVAAPGGTGQIQVTVAKQKCSTALSFSDPDANDGRLPPGTYAVNYLPRAAQNCISHHGAVLLGTFEVDGSGDGGGSFAVPSVGHQGNGATGYGLSGGAAICVEQTVHEQPLSTSAGLWGNQVPINIL